MRSRSGSTSTSRSAAECRAARGMMLEVATSYRMWAPVALLAGMKANVLAQAGM